MKKSKFYLGLTSVGIIVTTLLISGTQVAILNKGIVNDVLGLSMANLSSSKGSDYAEEDGSLTNDGYWEMIADSYEFCVNEEEQGAVLFKNDNNVLPLGRNERKVTLFGRNSAHLMLRSGAGGAAPNEKLVVHLDEAFEKTGFEINKTVWNLYKSGGNQGVSSNSEIKVDQYTSAVKDTFSEYNDAAIVTFSRFGTEDSDPSDGILDLQTNEKELLKMIKQQKDNGVFSKVIVLLNSPSAMGMEFADNELYGVDAVIWMGVPGYYSLTGVCNILRGYGIDRNGKEYVVNPSGHAPETFAKYSKSSAAYQNFGNFSMSGSAKGRGGTYVIYKEGIYVGYKYYETRYEDCVLGQGNADGTKGIYAGEQSWDYAEEMGYPFGFGLSYTTFEQKITNVAYDDAKDVYNVEVSVKNAGTVDGRASVQVYFQAPYAEGDEIEKAAINLGGYEKVEVAAGQTKKVTIPVERYFMTSYDYKTAKQYILDGGNYYFGIGNGAHEALNNIIALKKPEKKGSLVDHNGDPYVYNADGAKKVAITEDTETFKYSHYNEDIEVTNRFDNADINYWADGAADKTVTYLSRSDWEATFPTKHSGLAVTTRMNNELGNNRHTVNPEGAEDKAYYDNGNGVNFGVQLKDDNGENYRIKFADMAGVPFTGKYFDQNGVEHDADEMWEKFISQMSVSDLAISMSDARGIEAVKSVSKPSNSIAEGPEGLLAQFNYGDGRWATGFATGPIYSATWDHVMQKKFGAFYGEEALFCGAASVNAPGTNIIRTPYGSRASEYMSEDGIFNYYIASNVVSEARRKGLIMNIKHCFLNNQETNRHGVSTFCNEQAIREIYLRPFEGALTRGNGMGIMTSYNRIGCTYAAVHSDLMLNVMRGEWDYKGLIIDDAQTGSNTDEYANGPMMCEAGTNIFCLDSGRGGQLVSYVSSNHDGGLVKKMQESNKYIMYALLQSFLGDMGDVSDEEITASENPWWKTVLICIDSAFGTLTAVAAGFYIFAEFIRKEEPVLEAAK